jgi:hypothetical protein
MSHTTGWGTDQGVSPTPSAVGGPSISTSSASTPITASIAAAISATVGASGSTAFSTRVPGRGAASRISSAMLCTLAGWKRLVPRWARKRRRRPSRLRLTKYSSRGVRQCGPWTAPARSSVTGNRSPAASSSRSSAALRVLYEVSPGRIVRCSSVTGTGYAGKPSGSPCVSKLRPLSSS